MSDQPRLIEWFAFVMLAFILFEGPEPPVPPRPGPPVPPPPAIPARCDCCGLCDCRDESCPCKPGACCCEGCKCDFEGAGPAPAVQKFHGAALDCGRAACPCACQKEEGCRCAQGPED
jgi:hypothetical protein